VNWSPFSEPSYFTSMEESLARCDSLDLPELKRTLLGLRSQPRTFDWPPLDMTLEVCYDSEATSVATINFGDESSDDLSLNFNLERGRDIVFFNKKPCGKIF
jgi:hypothetical protein